MKHFISLSFVAALAFVVGFSGLTSGAGGTAGVATTGSTTGSTTGGSSGSSGTTGSTGLPPGNQPWQGLCRIERVEEFKSQTSYAVNNGATQVLPNMHVARAVLQVAGPPASPPGSTSVMVGGTPVNCPWTLDNYSYTVGTVSPGQEGAVISGSSIQPVAASVPTSSTTSASGVSVPLTAYGEVPIEISSNGPLGSALSPFSVCVGFHLTAHYTNPNTGQNVSVTRGTYQYYVFNLIKLPLYGSAIDTRRVYGQPNLAGEYPADPNAPPRNVDFTNWIYNGGCFVGTMPFTSTSDKSGLARMQFWSTLPGGYGTCLAATASLLDMGARSSPTGAESVSIYIPSTTDGNGSSPAGLTWAGVWPSIHPSGTSGTPGDYTQFPVSTLALSATNTADYLNWNIADTSNGGYYIPPNVFKYCCFALTDETTGPSWHYFGSTPYSAIATNFPGTDSQPRIWWFGLASTTNWTGLN